MPRFFVPEVKGNQVHLTGESAHHIRFSLRMKPGEELVICDGHGMDFHCVISKIDQDVVLDVLDKVKNETEPSLNVRLYQALPKGDKFEQIIQKSVELGVTEIVPVLTSRCISRPNASSMRKKLERYNKIAHEAAKQSGRGIVPVVRDLQPFKQAVQEARELEHAILFYECGGKRVSDLLKPEARECGIFVGSEGGFEPLEVDFVIDSGFQIASLGKRILRCETAPLCALSILMFYTKNI